MSRNLRIAVNQYRKMPPDEYFSVLDPSKLLMSCFLWLLVSALSG